MSQRFYEIGRWALWVVIPAAGTLLTVLAKAWNWNINLEAILATVDGVSIFIGTALGISKANNDKGAK